MKKLLIGVLALGALAGLASCDLPDILDKSSDETSTKTLGVLSEENWNTSKASLMRLIDDPLSQYTIRVGTRDTVVDKTKIQTSGVHSAYASWENSAAGRAYEFYIYSEADNGYLKSNAGDYSLNHFDEFNDFTSLILLAAMFDSVEYSTIVHQESDATYYHISFDISLGTDTLSFKLSIDGDLKISTFDMTADGDSTTVSILYVATQVDLPTPVGTYDTWK